MLGTYFAGEYWDAAEDTLSGGYGGSRYAGGSGVIQQGLLPRRAPLWGSVVAMVLAIGVGMVLWLGYRTGPWTMPFGLLGIFAGFFYSTRPLRWVSRGVGEIWVAFCYSWMPVAVGYYLQVGRLAPQVHWLALPIALTMFNVILLNEFPDYPADVAAGKRNLTARLGRDRATLVYALVAVAGWAGVALSYAEGAPQPGLWLHLPTLGLSLVVTLAVVRRRWQDRHALERMCLGNLMVNLGTTATYIAVFALWG